MTLALCPVRQSTAKEFVRAHHRHNPPPVGSVFQVGVARDGVLVGVAIAGRPVARALDDGATLEVIRVCVADDEPNVCSMLYGACRRAAMALGYRPQRVFTYTLSGESGSSLHAAGWVRDGFLPPRRGWDAPSRRRASAATDGIGKWRWKAAP